MEIRDSPKFASKIPDKIEVKALFQVEGQYKTFYDHQLNSVELAYAITVHKSQGSEYDHVAVSAFRRFRGGGK